MNLLQPASRNQHRALLSLVSWVMMSVGVQLPLVAQQPGRNEPIPLLSRNCASSRLEPLSDRPTVSIGREAYNSLFRLQIVESEAYLTCSTQPDTSQTARRVRNTLRLNFGLPDNTDARSRVAVTAYVDGERWGSVMLAPRDRLTNWEIDVSNARSISLETEKLSTNPDPIYVHFVRAELQSSSAGEPGQPSPEAPPTLPPRQTPTPAPSDPEPSEPSPPDDENGLPVDLEDMLDLCRRLRICR
jgi:hypothetical protein